MRSIALPILVAAGLVGGCRFGLDLGPPQEVEAPIVNPGCEEGTYNWSTFEGVLSTSTVARSGAASCQVCCMAGGEPACTLDDVVAAVMLPKRGDRYRADAWVRAVPGGSLPRYAYVKLRELGAQNEVPEDVEVGPGEHLSETEWIQISAEKTMVGVATEVLEVFIHQDAPATECFLVDDIELFQLVP